MTSQKLNLLNYGIDGCALERTRKKKCPLANNLRVSAVWWRDFSNVVL